MNTTLLIVIGFVGIIGVNIWATGRDREVIAAANLYEKCVIAEYGMTPLKYYEENKKYPKCGN